MMEIHGTIHFKLILPHFPGFQQEPLPEPVGFLCWGADGTCLRSRMNEISKKEANKPNDECGSE